MEIQLKVKAQSCQQNDPIKTKKCQPAARDAPVCVPDPVPYSWLCPVNSRSKAVDGNTTGSNAQSCQQNDPTKTKKVSECCQGCTGVCP